jgi:hypothetical protein
VRVVSIIQAKRVQLFWQNNRGLSMANRRKSALGFLCFPGFIVGNERFFRKTEQIATPKLTDQAFVATGRTIRSLACLLARLPVCYFSDLPATFLT